MFGPLGRLKLWPCEAINELQHIVSGCEKACAWLPIVAETLRRCRPKTGGALAERHTLAHRMSRSCDGGTMHAMTAALQAWFNVELVSAGISWTSRQSLTPKISVTSSLPLQMQSSGVALLLCAPKCMLRIVVLSCGVARAFPVSGTIAPATASMHTLRRASDDGPPGSGPQRSEGRGHSAAVVDVAS